jgi:hypothetical protein
MSEKWYVAKEALEVVINLLENVPTRNGIKSSEFIKVSSHGKDGAVFHLSSTLYGKAILRTGEPFPFEDLFLDRRLFIPFVNGGRESRSSDYIFIGDEKQLTVKHGSRRAVYSHTKPISGYEDPKDIDKANVTPIQKKLSQMIDCASSCATDDPITPTLNAVYVMQHGKIIEAMSSNQRLVFLGKVTTEKKPLEGTIAFPLGLVQTLRQEGATKLHWTNKIALVEFPKGKVWQAVKVAARKNFPYKDIRRYVKQGLQDQHLCSIPSAVFAKACDRLSGYTSALDSSDLALEVHLVKGSKKVQLKAGVEASKFTELIHSATKATKDIVLEWPLEQVLPIIMFGKDEGNFSINLSKKETSCLHSKNMTLLIGARSKK